MNKRIRTILFIIGAAIFNVIAFFTYFSIFNGMANALLPFTGLWFLIVWLMIFLSALICGLFTYRLALRFVKKKIPLERYLDGTILGGKW